MRALHAIALATALLVAGCAEDDAVVTIEGPPTLLAGESLVITVGDGDGSEREYTYSDPAFPLTMTLSTRGRTGPLSVSAELVDFIADASPPEAEEDLTARPPVRVVRGQGATELSLGGRATLFLSPSDFVMNETVAGEQRLGAALFAGRQLAVAEDGSFLATWDDFPSVRARLFGPDSVPRPNAIELTSHEFDLAKPGELSGFSAVAAGPMGFLVVWEHQATDWFDPVELRAQLFETHDATPGPRVELSAAEPGEIERVPTVVALEGGGFATVWLRALEGDTGFAEAFGDVHVRVLDSGARPVGASAVVSTLGAYEATAPMAAPLTGGGFAVVWADTSPSDDLQEYRVWGRVYDAEGVAQTAATLISGGEVSIGFPHVATRAGGEHLAVAWPAYDDDGDYVALQLFAQNDFDVRSQELKVADLAGSNPELTTCAVAVRDSDGVIGVVWSDSPGDDGDYDVFVRFYDREGTPLGKGQVVNTERTGEQSNPSIRAHGDDGFLIAWTDSSTAPPDVDAVGVRARIIYAGGTP